MTPTTTPPTKRPKLQTIVHQALLDAGPDGLSIVGITKAVAESRGRDKPTKVDRMDAARTIGQVVNKGGASPAPGERWTGVEGWVQRRPNVAPPLVDSGKLLEPEIGVDVTEEEYKKIAASRGRKKAADQPRVIDPSLLALASPDELRSYRLYQVRQNEEDWRMWVPAMFPDMASAAFAPFHEKFWTHVDSIRRGHPSRPHVDVWGRGLGKSGSVEMAVARLACLNRRRYVLYVSATQALADEHVETISSLFATETMALAYPQIANPEMGKHGQSRAWRRNRLRCASGFTIDAIGLDTAIRGRRIDAQRPDCIILDDIDQDTDGPAMVEKKIRAITRKLIPAGSPDVAVIAVQNLVHPESVFARLVSLRPVPGPKPPLPADEAAVRQIRESIEVLPAQFLSDRIVVGPIPAVWGLEYEERVNEDGTRWHQVTGGTPTWAAMTLERVQHLVNQSGMDAFLAESQHEEPDFTGSMFGDLDFTRDGPIRVSDTNLPRFVKTCVWVDPAISSTDRSDSCGVVCDSLGADRNYYRRAAWEKIASPTDALTKAIEWGLLFGADVVGVETDQGGDTWETIYRQILPGVVEKWRAGHGGTMPKIPKYVYEKAGASRQSKAERAGRMRAEYDLGRIKHIGGQVIVLERGLRRFPEYKPFDVVDAAYWSWRWLAEQGGDKSTRVRARYRRPTGALPEPAG